MSSHVRDPQQIPNGYKTSEEHVTGYMGLDIRF